MLSIVERLMFDIKRLKTDPIKQNIRHTQAISVLETLIRLCHQNNIAIESVNEDDWQAAIRTIRNIIDSNEDYTISFWLNSQE